MSIATFDLSCLDDIRPNDNDDGKLGAIQRAYICSGAERRTSERAKRGSFQLAQRSAETTTELANNGGDKGCINKAEGADTGTDGNTLRPKVAGGSTHS